MADLTPFKPEVVSAASKETKYFLSQFKGHTTIVGLGPKGEVRFPNPSEEDFRKIQQCSDEGYNIYFTVNETSDKGRKAEHIEKIRAIFGDSDVAVPTPQQFKLPPSIIVRSSSHGGGFKFHYYWLCDNDLTGEEGVAEWNQVQHGLVHMHNMDIQAKDLSRILRVPGYRNWKYPDEENMCKLIQCDGTVYDWETIVKYFPRASPEVMLKSEGKSSDGKFNMEVHRTRFLNPSSGESGQITDSLNRLIIHWRNHYSAVNVKKNVDHLFEEIDPILHEDEEFKRRYFTARSQVDKFIRTADTKISAERATEIANLPITAKIQSLPAKVPQALEWDWSVLQSNELPRECIPDYLFEAASEIGDWNGIGKDPAVISAIFMTSALLSKNVLIHETYDSLMHNSRLGVIVVMDTGASKSSIYDQMNKPFFEYETRLQKQWEEKKNEYIFLAKRLNSQIASLEKSYDKKTESSDSEMLEQARTLGGLQTKIDAIPLVKPALHSSNITEEAILRKMEQNNGVIALVSDDARDAVNLLLGQYKQQGLTGESIYISGFSGTRIVKERKGDDEEVRVESPCLNTLFFVQPDAAIKLLKSDMYIPSGLAARMPMYFYPTCGSDIVRNRQRRAINQDRMSAYYDHMSSICYQRHDNPLHVRISGQGMKRLKELDHEFADLLESQWQDEHKLTNKLVSSALQYATCIAALDDPEFKVRYRDTAVEGDDYTLSLKYINMGFMFAKVLFEQSIRTHHNLDFEEIPRKARVVVNRLIDFYHRGRILEGFVIGGSFRNHFAVGVRLDLPTIVDFLLDKGWLYTSVWDKEKRKLNGGDVTDKLVDMGDIVYHLNLKGIQKRKQMGLDEIEKAK